MSAGDALTEAAATLEPVSFSDIEGWTADDHAAAFAAFRLSAEGAIANPPKARGLGLDAVALAAVLARARTAGDLDAAAACRFFEQNFQPVRVLPATAAPFFTGYYEPEVEGRLTPDDRFHAPVYRRPPDLVEVRADNRPADWPEDIRFARQAAAGIKPYADRGEIERGALAGRGLELVYLADPVDVFFIHIQGSARVRLADGRVMRITFDGKSGHAYTPIGRVLIQRGALARDHVSMASIRDWLAAHPEEGRQVMWENRSFIFFREAPVDDPALGPVAAAGVPLTPGRSLAVDRTLHSFHAPVFVATEVPGAGGGSTPFRRLMIAQDTGSAILGPARGDIFFGSGDAAGAIAGSMKAEGAFILLLPKHTDAAGQ